ncbi:MAG: hypothetical protein KOO62_09775 [candidate division Zixibacteria bacterium]|nr:hypothetical protein [candidate division Zixibacteria bacterium]
MAATIESAFDVKVTLVKGHNGIFEVSTNNDVLYSNNSQCSQAFPSDDQIIEQIGQFIGLKPKRDMLSEPQSKQGQNPHNILPNKNTDSSITEPLPIIIQTESNLDCGCGPEGLSLSGSSGCCDPKENNSGGMNYSNFKKLLSSVIILAAFVLAMVVVAKKTGWYNNDNSQISLAEIDPLALSGAGCATAQVKDELLTELVGNREAVFALLPCDHEGHTQELRDKVSPAINKLQAQGKRTDLVVVNPSSPAYARLIELHTAESFPCLAVIGMSCASSLLSDDFTEERLFGAFVTATSPISSSSCSTPCGTQTTGSTSDSSMVKSSCCP